MDAGWEGRVLLACMGDGGATSETPFFPFSQGKPGARGLPGPRGQLGPEVRPSGPSPPVLPLSTLACLQHSLNGTQQGGPQTLRQFILFKILFYFNFF